MWPALAVGAGLGLLKHQLVDKPQQRAQGRVAAAQTQFSPWTGMGAGQLGPQSSALGSMMQGGMTGAQLSQAYDSYNQASKLKDLQMQKLQGEIDMQNYQKLGGDKVFSASGKQLMLGNKPQNIYKPDMYAMNWQGMSPTSRGIG